MEHSTPRSWEDTFHQDSSSYVVYISDQAHFSVEKLGWLMLGLGPGWRPLFEQLYVASEESLPFGRATLSPCASAIGRKLHPSSEPFLRIQVLERQYDINIDIEIDGI